MDSNEEEVTREVRTTGQQVGNTNIEKQTVRESSTVSSMVIVRRVVWYLVGLIVVFLVLRLVLVMLGANEGNAFVDFVYAIGGFFAAPFFGLFNYQPAYGQFYFELSTFVAIFIYVLAGWGLAALFALGDSRAEV
ncbi:MAG: hypothetical protein WBB94_00070 [Candidatus Saccharimonadaceae bacterium]